MNEKEIDKIINEELERIDEIELDVNDDNELGR